MNSLSWMIYAADVAGSVSGLLSSVAFLGTFGAGASLLSWAIMGGSPSLYSWDDKEAKTAEHADMRGKLAKVVKPALIVSAVCALAASIIPGRETIYAIAASEMGEQVVTSPIAGKALKALDAWLDRQIAEEPAK